MARWEPNAAPRLMEAAVLLFEEQGFEQTTVEQIAARAGLTKRTFFRYFPDKREILFGGGNEYSETFAEGVRGAATDASPLEAVAAGVQAVIPVLLAWGEGTRRRQRVIAASPELRERDLSKQAALVLAAASALRERGTGEPEATVAAEAGVAAYRVGFERWVDSPGSDLDGQIRASFDALRTIAA